MPEARALPSRIELRASLERLRVDFPRLVDEVSDTQWVQQCVDTRWTNGEVLAHLQQVVGFVPQQIDHARRGKDMLNFPRLIRDPVNYLLVKRLALRHSRPSLKAAFNRAIDEALVALDGVRDDEWGKGARFFGAGFRDIEHIFRTQAEHFAKHAADVRAAIGRGARPKPVDVRRQRSGP
jgi:hypothetical protein